jgi:hypothetical protein
LQGGLSGKGLDRNELLLKAHFLGDVSKLMVVVANYTFGFLITTWTLHLEGRASFGSTKCGVNFSPSVDDELHRCDQ